MTSGEEKELFREFEGLSEYEPEGDEGDNLHTEEHSPPGIDPSFMGQQSGEEQGAPGLKMWGRHLVEAYDFDQWFSKGEWSHTLW